MRIGEFSRVSGVRRETIHFYIRKGLLPPPEKKNARVSYFGAEHLERLLLIRRMRQEGHLPLSVIREQLEAGGEGHTGRLVPRFLEYMGLDDDDAELSRDSAAEQARLTVEQLERLEALGLLRPASVNGRLRYTKAEAKAAAAARLLLDQGVELESLRFASRYAELAEEEMGFIFHHLLSPPFKAGRREEVSGALGMQALQLLEGYMRRQVRREFGLHGRDFSDLADPLDDV